MWKQVAARFVCARVHAHAHLHHQHHHDHTSKSIFGSAPVFFGKLAADGSVAEGAPAPLMAETRALSRFHRFLRGVSIRSSTVLEDG